LSGDPTRELPKESPFEARVLAELAAIRVEQGAIRTDIAALDSRLATVESRLTTVESHLTTVESRLVTLEDKVDSRLRETRPIWEAVQLAIKRLEMKFDKVILDLYELRTDVGMLDKRLKELEAR
jgi:chromosome segregation ATPase